MPDLPDTVDISGLEVFASGKYNGDQYSDADLDAMVSAFGEVGFQPTVKAGHADGQENAEAARKVFGAPALGYASKIYRKGAKLVADLTKVPRRFADLIKRGAYNRVSSEIFWNYDSNGKKFPRVLKSIAFLGADIPALTNLKEIEALYSLDEASNRIEGETRIYTVEVTTPPSPPPTVSAYRDPTSHDNAAAVPSAELTNRTIAWPEVVTNTEPAPSLKPRGITNVINKKLPKEARMSDKNITVSQEELDELIKQRVDAMTAEKEKEYEYRVIKAREEGKIEKEKEAEALRAEVRKLAMEKRSEQINNWISKLTEAGKVSPAEAARVRAIREWIPDETEKVKVFEQMNGRVKESEDSPAKIFESLFENRATAFKTFSNSGSEDSKSEDTPLDDPGAELDRLAKKYQQEQAEKGTKIDYMKALQVTQGKNPDLARRYHNSRH